MRGDFLAVNVGDMHDGKMNPFVVLELSRRERLGPEKTAASRETSAARATEGGMAALRRLLRLLRRDGSGEVLPKGHRRHLDPR
jgi:hypothetical protein